MLWPKVINNIYRYLFYKITDTEIKKDDDLQIHFKISKLTS